MSEPLVEGRMLNGRYEVLETLGVGAILYSCARFGAVAKAPMPAVDIDIDGAEPLPAAE